MPVLIPLFVCEFKHAGELATAMECRCYTGGEGRTRMKQLRSGGIDYAACVVVAILTAAVFVTDITLAKMFEPYPNLIWY